VSQEPYPIWGVIESGGVKQATIAVTIRNVTKAEEYTTQTNDVGEYAIDLGDATKFPSGYADGDQIRVSVSTLNIKGETSVDLTNYPEGRRVDLALWQIDDSGTGTDDFDLKVTFIFEEAGIGTDEFDLEVTLIFDETAIGTDDFDLRTELIYDDSGVGVEEIDLQADFLVEDAGNGIDDLILGASFLFTETVSALESVEAVPFGVIPISDSGQGTDSIFIPSKIEFITESGLGQEAIETGIEVTTVEDQGSGLDLIDVTGVNYIDLDDTGLGEDRPKIFKPVEVSESGVALAAIEWTIMEQELIFSESGTGLDEITVYTVVPHAPFVLPIKVKVRKWLG